MYTQRSVIIPRPVTDVFAFTPLFRRSLDAILMNLKRVLAQQGRFA